MPWCETCDRHYNARSVAPDGTCIRCGSFIADGTDEEPVQIPWHFWLLVVGLVLYLGWRLIEFIGWLVN